MHSRMAYLGLEISGWASSWTRSRQNVVVYARMLTYNDEEPWPQNLGAVAIAN